MPTIKVKQTYHIDIKPKVEKNSSTPLELKQKMRKSFEAVMLVNNMPESVCFWEKRATKSWMPET